MTGLFAPFLVMLVSGQALDVTNASALRFNSYGSVPTYIGIVNNFTRSTATVHVFNPFEYDGHLDFVNRGLSTPTDYHALVAGIVWPGSRKYMPFTIYDLESAPITIGQRTYTWAIRVSRYRYRDTIRQLSNMLIRLNQ